MLDIQKYKDKIINTFSKSGQDFTFIRKSVDIDNTITDIKVDAKAVIVPLDSSSLGIEKDKSTLNNTTTITIIASCTKDDEDLSKFDYVVINNDMCKITNVKILSFYKKINLMYYIKAEI